LLALICSTTNAQGHTFNIRKLKATTGNVTNGTDELESNSPMDYLNVIDMQIGVPRQDMQLLVDINYPTPIIYNKYCMQWNNNTYPCDVYPYSVKMTYDFENSLVFHNFTTGSSNNNKTSVYYNAGFRLSAA
jgi:hypothetical protein